MHRFIICLLAMLSTILAADVPSVSSESDILNSACTPLATLYGVPETNIAGVNVINGDYNYSSVDFDLPGADPLILQRTYCSSNFQERAFFHSWTHNLSGLTKSYVSDHRHVIVSGSLSGELPFRGSKRDTVIDIQEKVLEKGVTNCGQGEISGRTNIKNMKVKYWSNATDVINADGTEHKYIRIVDFGGKEGSTDCLAYTKKPNGIKLSYATMNGYGLKRAKLLTHDGNTANQLILNHPYRSDVRKFAKKKTPFSIEGTSDDGKTAKYFFDWHKKPSDYDILGLALMSKFESNHLPSESYSYTDRPAKLNNRQGKHHRTKIDYYQKGDMMFLHGYHPKEVTSRHIADRVKRIQVAVNSAEDLRTAYHFAYYRNTDTKKAFTEVYDEHNHLSKFCYSTKDHRLTLIERYEGTSDYSIYSRERLCFGEKDTNREGDLLFKTIEEPDGTIHYGEHYRYDERGNVLRKQLHFRTFTDLVVHPIKEYKGNYQYHPQLEEGEIKTITCTYNNLNLPTSEDDGRLKTSLTYHSRNGKDLNLLKSKFSQENQKTLRREFYDFDGNVGCTLKIVDDGSGCDREDLQDVHIRKITRLKNRQESFAGLPLEIEEWGSIGKSEHRISRTVLTYDTHGYVERQSHYDSHDKLAYKIKQIRDIQGNVILETNPLGQTTHREYNQYRSLLEEHGPSPKYFMKYTYDWLQRPVTETRQCVDGIALTTVKSYDLKGKVTKIQDPYGAITEFIYNEQGLPVQIIHPPTRTERGKWIRPVEVKQYNFMGHLTSETDPSGAVTLYKPNDAGLPLKITYPDNTVELFRYSIYGEVLEKKQINGSKVFYDYDAFSRPTSEKTYDCDGKLLKESHKEYSGLLLLSETDGEGLVTSYKYNHFGKISEIRRGNALTKYAYDTLGRVQEEQRYFGKTSKDYIAKVFTYDLLNRVTCEAEADASGAIHSRVKTTYDPEGNITSTKTWNHGGTAVVTNTYDPRGNLSSSTDPLGNTTHYHHRYDFFFEGVNLPCVEVTDPTGVKTITVSDHRGSVISVQVYSPIGELLSDEEMFHDTRGNLIRKEHHLPSETIVTLLEYDTSSRLVRQVSGEGTPEQMTTTFTYNSYGELSKTEYNDGTSKNRIYDRLGRLSEEWSDSKTIHYRYTYNQQDLLKEVENCLTQKKTEREHSPEGILLSEQFENGLKISYHYDRMSRLTESIYPDGSSIKQIYNPVFLTRVERIKNGAVIYDASFEKFDLTGKPKQIIFPKNSGTLSLTYDVLNRPTSLSSPQYKEKEICYDTRGLLISKIVNDDLQKFEHDHLQQITLEQTSLYAHTYQNDALHRQISVDGYAQTHNAVHQLTQGIHAQYKFDAKGRRTKDGKTKFTYSKFDCLINIRQGDSSWEYTYDAFNRKMSRTFAGATVYYLYDGHEEIGTYDSEFRNIDLKVLSEGEGSIPIAIELGSQHYAPLISSQGHIVGLTDIETGNLADRSDLTIFGEDLAQKPLSPWRFCGKRHETSELGLIDFGFRIYHPKSAQWLTQDPLGEADGPNLYAYVMNNPTCCIDRFGLFMDGFEFKPSWSNFENNCSWIGGKLADSTIYSPRFTGALQAAGGASEYLMGMGVAGVGTAGTATGAGAPIGIPAMLAGSALMAHGVDNICTGFYQVLTGRYQDSQTLQCLKGTGMSDETALAADACIGLSGGLANLAKSGTKVAVNVIPQAMPSGNISKQIWSNTKKRTAVQNAYKHWKDHGHEFSDIQNAKQYVEKAHNFFRDPSALSRMRPDGCLIRYDPSTNVFGSYSSSGVPKTMFKPGISKPLPSRYLTPLEYFYGQ